MKILIVRDRRSAGGGIFHFYEAIAGYLGCRLGMIDVGRPHAFYGNTDVSWLSKLPTCLRLLFDWACLLFRLATFPGAVVLNPCMDPVEGRSLPRDAVNLLLCKLFRCKVLVFWRGWDNGICGSPEFPGGNGGWLSRIYRMADAHVVLASDFRDDLRRWGFTTPIHLETTVVGDGVMERSPGARKLQSGRPFRVLYLSRVEEAKGVFEMLEAFALLANRAPGRYQFIVAGDGPGLGELQEKSKEFGVESLQFRGYVSGEEKIRCFLEADVFCFLSYTEGMPNAVLEAMAMGLPLVSTSAGGLKDILEDGRSGYIVSYDPRALVRNRCPVKEVADRIERLATDIESYQAMSAHNSMRALERFAAHRVAARLEAICRQVTGCGD